MSRQDHFGEHLFWASAAAIFYTYAGYPLLLWLATAGWKRASRDVLSHAAAAPDTPNTVSRWPTDSALPHVNVIVSARDEAGTIEHLLASCAALDYPRGRLHVTVVVAAGDEPTWAAAGACRSRLEAVGITLNLFAEDPSDPGKPGSLSLAARNTDGEVLVFTDANVLLERGAVRALVQPLMQAGVGCVSGRKRTVTDPAALSNAGDRTYWSYEAAIKRREGLLHSVAGADGALYAIRRAAFRPPQGCADDLSISLQVVHSGERVVFAEAAVAFETSTRSYGDEFRRKLRTQTCAMSELWRQRALFSPARSVFAWILFSHKVMRYVAAYGLAGMLAGSALSGQPLFRLLFAGQLAGYATAIIGGTAAAQGRLPQAASVPLYGLLAQAAALAAPFRLLRRPERRWKSTPR